MQGYRKSYEYTFDEQKAILDYIIAQKYYIGFRGNKFWQQMAAKKIVNRSWQSIKEHFRRKLIDILHVFNIPQEERRLIRAGWEASSQVNKDQYWRKVKRPRHEDDDNGFKRPRSPSNFNLFSDEEEEMNKIRTPINLSMAEDSSVDNSPNLLVESEQNTADRPSTSKTNCTIVQENAPIQIDSDSDDVSVVHIPVKRSEKKKSCISNNREKASHEEFSLGEDMRLINFMKSDKANLKRRNELSIYTYYRKIYPNSKTPKQLRDRFVNHIFPNIYKYTDLTNETMCQIYKDAGVDIPNNLNALLQKSQRNAVVEEINTDLQLHNCDPEIDINSINCIYCHILLNGQSHIFVSDLNKSSDQQNVTTLLSKKFNIAPEFIHHTDFASFHLLEQINKFRTSIYTQYENIITQNLSCNNLNLQEIFSGLEICFQSFSSSDDEESENSDSSCEIDETRNIVDTLNTQKFIKNKNSTLQKKNSGNNTEHSEGSFRIVEQIQQEIDVQGEEHLSSFSNEQNYSAEIPQIVIEVEPDYNFNSENNTEHIEGSFRIVQQIEQEIDVQGEEHLSSFSNEKNYSAEIPQIIIKVEPDYNFNSGNNTEHSEGSFRIVQQIKQEVDVQREEHLSSFSNEQNYSAELPQIIMKVEPDFNISDTTQIYTIDSEMIEENQQQILEGNRGNDGNDSQYLQSISTQGSADIRNAVSRIVAENSKYWLLASPEMYHTADNFSQDME